MFEEEIKAKNIEIAKINEIKESMKVLNKLPDALSYLTSGMPDLVKNGTAKKVANTLGFGEDNIVKATKLFASKKFSTEEKAE